MNTGTSQPLSSASAAARAEAAVWIARLHGPQRSPEVEAGFRRWIAEDEEKRRAFELLTDTWDKSAHLRRRPLAESPRWRIPGFGVSFSRVAATAVAAASTAAIATFLLLHSDAVSTRVGEQRTFALEDGTRVYLNTDSRVVAHYDKSTRRVELEKGEAMFEVAKRPDWPFIVVAGDRQVRALGTSFSVRRDDQDLVVTLVEGKVTVSSDTPTSQPSSTATSDHVTADAHDEVTLLPGQRLTFGVKNSRHVDMPAMDKVMAWQHGKVALDNTPLADAVAEMNRYSTTRLVVENPNAAAIRISGIFRAGDQENFARAVAKAYQLEVRSESDSIVLAGGSGPTTQ
jgi:transmembrane sensor